jgi:hypothetical protein
MKTKNVAKSMMIAAALLCGTVNNAQAQSNNYYETEDEVAISFGAGTNSQIFSAFSNLFGVMCEALITSVATAGTHTGHTSYDNEKYIPPISVEYFHHLNKTVSIGGIGCFNGYTSDMFFNWQQNSGDGTATLKSKDKIGSAKKYYATLMPAVKFDWVRTKNFGVYSKVGIGLTYMYEKEIQKKDDTGKDIGDKKIHSESRFMGNFQASLLGIEAGSQKIRGFAELGCGEQGILLAGLRYKF